MAAQTQKPTGAPVADQLATLPSKDATLQGHYVTLVGMSTRYANDLYPLIGGEQNADLWTYMGDGPYSTLHALRNGLEAKATSTDPSFYIILLTRGGGERIPVGICSLMRIDIRNRVIEIGNLLFSKSLQRTPAATETIFLLLRYAFEDLGYRRVEWKCDSLNAPSRRAAQRFGFQFEGVFRQHMIYKGRNRDTAWFSILDREWEARKKVFEEWLGESNFDEDGRQRKTLEQCRGR
ncbi:hypothetical protein H2203_007855 [Taxawa tesnikishii (nom. ined.)]|nr:hypothetical protein H2203_007855 [Dothideales sp. JES 119]